MTKQTRLRHAFVTAVLAAAVTLVWPQASDAVRDQRYFPGDWTSYTSVRFVNSAVLTNDILYIGTRGGIARYNRLDDRWLTPLTESDGLLMNTVGRLAYNSLTDELFAETGIGISVYNRLTQEWSQVPTFPASLQQPWDNVDMTKYFLPFGYTCLDPKYVEDPNRRSYAVVGGIEDDRGLEWIGTWGLFLWTVEMGAINAYPIKYGLYQDAVAAMFIDSLGMYFGGPSSIDGERGFTEYVRRDNQWNYYESQYLPTFTTDEINDIDGKLNGRYLWMATEMGVIKFDRRNKSFSTIDRRNGLTNELVWSVCLDDDILWIGTETGIDGYYIPGDSIFHATTDVLQNNRIYDIDVTEDVVWLGTDDGLYRLVKPTPVWKRYSYSNSPLDGRVRTLTHSGHYLYAGTDHGIGVVDLRGMEAARSYESPSVLPDGNIYRIAVTDSIIWASTQSGLIRLNPFTLETRVFDTSDGLLDIFVEDIVVDGDYLWLATYRGVNRFRWNNPLRID